MTFFQAFILELAAKVAIWLIRAIATETGAADLIFMVMERIGERSSILLRSLVSSLAAAVVDRGQWLLARICDHEFTDGVEPKELEGFVLYFSSSFAFGYLDFHLGERITDKLILKSWLPAASAHVLPYASYILFAFIVAGIARNRMGERDPLFTLSYRDALTWLRCVFVSCICIVGDFSLVLGFRTDLRQLFFEGAIILAGAVAIAYGSSAISERFSETLRSRSVSRWSKYGRPFARRDAKVTAQTLARLKKLHQAGIV